MITAPTVSRPLLRYLGGKWDMRAWVIAHMPPCERYVEPYAGAASVLLGRTRTRFEVLNDADERLVTLLRVLQTDEGERRLLRRLAFTAYSRSEYELACEPVPPTGDPVEVAARTVVRCWFAFSGATLQRPTGFRTVMSYWRNSAREWQSYQSAVPAIAERLRGVLVERLPALDVIRLYDEPAPGRSSADVAPTTLLYVDPPYLPETRGSSARYTYDMTAADHVALLDAVTSARAMVVLSGYRSDLYDEALTDWRCIERTVQADGNVPGDPRHRTECLWLTPRTADALDAASSVAARAPLRTLFDCADA